jgi:branched-chain amino acid transport system substrate-binding protein
MRLLATVSVIAVFAAACGDDDDEATDTTASETTEASDTTASETTVAGPEGAPGCDTYTAEDGSLKIGLLMPQSGDLASIYDALHEPALMAIEEINAAGGVNGVPVACVDGDDGTSADVAATALDTLVNSDAVNAIVGPASSGTMLGILDKVKTAGVQVCSGSNTAADLTTADDGGLYFRTAPPDKLQGPALAQVILNDGHSNVAIVARNDSYGTGFAEALEDALVDGGATVAVNAAYDPAADSYSADVSAVKDAGPDSVVVIGFDVDGGKVIKEMIGQGVGPKDIPIYTADGMQGGSFFEKVDASDPSLIEGLGGTAPAAAPNGVTSPFNDAYAATGFDTIFSSYYYDCTILTALAAQAAGSTASADIAAKMLEVSSEGEACNTYADCLALLEAGTDINYEGASGPVDLDEVGEPTVGVYDVWAYDAEGAPANKEGVDQIVIDAADLG